MEAQAQGGAMLEAEKYARFGWHVFPCKRDKTPLTEHGCLDGTTDIEVIDRWWGQWPDAAIGLACGPSGLVVLDHDPRHDPEDVGKARLFDLLGNTGTRQAQTGSGGRHWYFTAPEGVSIRNSSGKLGPGLDVRGDGGYVIAPPSLNESGAYVWLNKANVAALPATITRALTITLSSPAPAIPEGGQLHEGQRNDRLASLAGTLRRKNTSPLSIEKALLAINDEQCVPPLNADEVHDIAHSIGRYKPAESLVAGQPSIDLLSEDSVRIITLLGDGTQAVFTFTEMEKDRRELAAHLEVRSVHAPEPYQQRINLESNSARTELRRELDAVYGKEPAWGRALNTVWSQARTTFLNQDRATRVTELPRLRGQRYLVAPLMPFEGTTIIFGDGSSGKSYVSLALALASASGQTIAGLSAPKCPVLYVDYEDSGTTFRRRTERLTDGLGLDINTAADLHYWGAKGIPLKDQWDAVKRTCERHGIGWVIVDSAGVACGDRPEESQSALGYFAALARIGLPCLTIAHIVKADTPEARKKPFGTNFWHNLARMTWYVHKAQHEGEDVFRMAFYCKKANDGPSPLPLGFEVRFEGWEGPVVVARHDLNGTPELVQHTSAQNRIWAALSQAMSITDLAEATSLAETTIRSALKAHPEKFVEIGGLNTSGGRPARLWSRVIREEF